jgi:hypothetical protein
MGKHVVSPRLLSVITAVALVIGISAGSAQAVSYQDLSRTAASSVAGLQARVVDAASSLAPCTKPLFGSDKDCESTSPTVDRWVTFNSSADESCTYTLYVNWGDGRSSQRTYVDPAPSVTHLITSHTYSAETKTTTYTETVTSAVNSGTCIPIDTTVFHFTHLLSAIAPWQPGTQLITKCNLEAAAELASLGVGAAEVLGLFVLPGGQFVGLLVLAGSTYLLFKFINGCVVHNPSSSTSLSTTSLPPLPPAFAYGAKHPGKRFKPHGKVPARPQITGVFGYQKGSLVYFSLTYADPGHDAKGFGFVGINGAGWALEIHPFTKPSYGIVGKDRIDYPFNLECGTPQEYKSWVEAWIYDSQGIRSNPVEVALSCTT